MQTGWIKLHRALLASETFKNPKLLKVWIYCLLKATHKEHEQLVGRQIVKLYPGQFIYGRRRAASDLNLPESTIKDYIKLLQNAKNITSKSTNKYSVITIIKWEEYQSSEEKPPATQPTSHPTNGQQMDTNKNIKNVKKDIYVEIISYLNQKAGKNFSYKTKETQGFINGRLADGYTLEDFKRVVDNKVLTWKGVVNRDGTLLENFLRPDTLFRPTNFESYLNEKPKPSLKQPQVPFGTPASEIAEARRRRNE